MFIALSETKSTQQSGVHHAVVLGSIMSDKSIQKRHNPVLNSHPAKTQGNVQAEVIETKNYKSHGCIQQSALWIDVLAAT